MGRSRGGFSTKVHIITEALGNPLRLLPTAGQVPDLSQGEALLAGYSGERVIADKSYDADSFLEVVRQMGAVPVIPPRRHRKEQREYDTHLYRERHLVECCINKMKQYRRVFSRFDKLVQRYRSFLSFVAVLIWLR